MGYTRYFRQVDFECIGRYFIFQQKCIRDKLRDHKYPTRDQFLEDIELIYANTRDYNGLQHPISQKAIELTDFVKSRIDAEQDKLAKLEKKINPLLGNIYLIWIMSFSI